MTTLTRTIKINDELDLITARMRVRKLAYKYGLSTTSQACIAFAITIFANGLNLGSGIIGKLIIDQVDDVQGKNGIRVLMRMDENTDYQKANRLIDSAKLKYIVDEISVEELPSSVIEISITKMEPVLEVGER